MGGKKNRTKWRKLSLGGDSAAEEPTSTAQYAQDIQTDDHAPQEDDCDFDDLELHNGDAYQENLLSLIYDERNGDGPPTLLFPNLGPLPIVGFSSQPPPPAGPPLVIPAPPPPLDVPDNVSMVNGQNDVDDNANGSPEVGVYVNGLWIPRSELYQQYGGRNPPCLVYHPIPWVRVRSAGSPSHGPRNCRLGRGIQPSDAQYRLYLSRRTPPHRGSWRSPRRAHPSLSPYLWCLSPPSQPASPPVYEEQQVPLQHESEATLPAAPPNNDNSQTPMCQASSSYVYPGYSFGPPVFTAPVLPLQPSTASKHLVTSSPPPVTTEVPPSPPSPPPPASTSPKKKKKKKGKTKPLGAMDCSTVDGPVAVSLTPDPVVTSGQVEASECIVHFVDAFFRSTLCQAQRQLIQLKHDRLANGYKGECLATLRNQTRLRTPSPNLDVSRAEDLKVTSPATTPSPSIVFTVDGDADADPFKVEAFSVRVAENIMIDLSQGQTSTTTPHVVASRSQLFLEGLESSYSGVSHIERFSADFVELVFRQVFQNLQPASSHNHSHHENGGGSADSNVFLEGFADQLLSNIFNSAKEEFRGSFVENVSAIEQPAQEQQPKTLVHFLEQGFHAPSSETFDNTENLDDDVLRERYMEGDPALSHLDADFDQELNTLQDKMRLTDQSIYKISYDEISYTDQSEGEEQDFTDRIRSASVEREAPRFPPLARVYENHLRSEIPVHEAETGSEAGSEDVELIPHRYESGVSAQEKHLYVNKLSLATELLRTHENLPYDDDFKRIIQEEFGAAEEGTVNLGFVCDESKVVTTGPRSLARFSAADSGVQSEESDEDVDVVKKTTQPNQGSQGSLITRDDNKRVGKHVHENGGRVKSFVYSRGASLGYASSNSLMVCY